MGYLSFLSKIFFFIRNSLPNFRFAVQYHASIAQCVVWVSWVRRTFFFNRFVFYFTTLCIETIFEDALVVKYWPNIHLILHFTSDCCSSDILQILFELFRIKQQIKFQGNALIKYEIPVCLLHAWAKKIADFFFTLKSLALYFACSFMIGTLKKMSLHAYLHRERLSVDLVFWPPGAVSTPVEADVR